MDDAVMRRSTLSYGLVALAALLGAAMLLLPSLKPEHPEDWLLRSLADGRVGEGRLFQAQRPYPGASYPQGLRRASVAVLSMARSPHRDRVSGLLDARNGRLSAAATTLRNLLANTPDDPQLINDLGVVYLAMGEDSAIHYFNALALFERAHKLAPSAPAPLFNTVVALQKTAMEQRIPEALRQYLRVEMNPVWQAMLADERPSAAELLRKLRAAANAEDAAVLVQRYAPDYRRVAMQSLVDPPSPELSPEMEFVIRQLAVSDPTLTAMNASLQGPDRAQILAARAHMRDGIAAYFRDELPESIAFYDAAEAALTGAGAPFDRLWLKLKRADTLIRMTKTGPAESLIDHALEESIAQGWPWLTGQALTVKGLVRTTTSDYGDILPFYAQAVAALLRLGAIDEALRPQYYLAVVHSMAGDATTSLNLTIDALGNTLPDDHVRRSQSFWLAAVQLHRLGFIDYATTLAEQALAEAKLTLNPRNITSIAPYLGILHAQGGNYAAAEEIRRYSADVSAGLQSQYDHALLDLVVNLLCGEIQIGTGRLEEAERCLDQNIEILNRLPIKVPEHFANTLYGLATIHKRRGELEQARRSLREAVEVIEVNDAYFSSATLRTPFENERRRVYDALIAFEADHGGMDNTWSLAQQYRAKLFLELTATLGSQSPGRTADRATALDPRDIPPGVQVVEYFMLEDRLLIWVLSGGDIRPVVVPVTRKYLESQAEIFHARLQSREDVVPVASGLYQVLIRPVEEYLRKDQVLVLIPDGVLHRLPFAALYSAETGTYLLERYELLESMTLSFFMTGGSTRPSRHPAVAFGSTIDTTGEDIELLRLKPYYSNLAIVNGSAALKANFLSALRTASVLHFAGHSEDAADSLRSAILLGGAGGTQSVTAFEISRHPMPRNAVVVLASCDSSVGHAGDGVGVRGLTSAFLISGAGAVVGSLWPVEASSTSRLAIAFHERFAKRGLPVATALRQAQIEALKEGGHPYGWSAFVVTGNLAALR